MTTEASFEILPDQAAPAKKKVSKTKQVDPAAILRYRIMIFFRFVLSIVGGYYLAAISSILIGMSFSTEPLKANAVLSATMLAFVMYCAVFIWVFMVKSTLKAWLGVIVPSVILAVIYWLIKG